MIDHCYPCDIVSPSKYRMDNGYRFIMAFFLIRKRSIFLEEWLSKIGGRPATPDSRIHQVTHNRGPQGCVCFLRAAPDVVMACRDPSLKVVDGVICHFEDLAFRLRER